MNKRLVVVLIIIVCALLIITFLSCRNIENIEPNNAYFKIEPGNLIMANKGSYSWNDKNTHIIADAISPTEMDYAITLDVKKDEIVYFENIEGTIRDASIYDVNNKEIIDYDIIFDANEKYIIVPKLVGEYIIKIDTVCNKGQVWYSIKLNIHDI